ncbi:MAG: RluA family pseudouridine synthase [Clostridia bacterium]|nr:RluA family pseudouridine synthase [Clostridia bacterium]
MVDIKQTIIAETSEKLRLDNFLTQILDGWTRSQIKKQIDSLRVAVNGKTAKAGLLIKNGDIISLDLIADSGLENIEPENIPLSIVYEDENFAVINKPQGMVVHPAPGNYTGTLVNALLYHFKEISTAGESYRPGIVHRIDKDTSGLIVVAKNNEAHFSLASQIAKHTCYRRYIALCEGEFKEADGTIVLPLARDKKDFKKIAVDPNGKYAETHYKVEKFYVGYTLVNFKLETGRTHQIRVHTKAIGHPIVGDPVYGYKTQKFKLNGQLLHAKELELDNPKTGERMVFKCEIPSYFLGVLSKLKERDI